MRIERAAVDPLVPGFWVPRANRDKIWATIRYEKLNDFCYVCGIIDHVDKQCFEGISDRWFCEYK